MEITANAFCEADSGVADATREPSPNVPWVETARLKSHRRYATKKPRKTACIDKGFCRSTVLPRSFFRIETLRKILAAMICFGWLVRLYKWRSFGSYVFLVVEYDRAGQQLA